MESTHSLDTPYRDSLSATDSVCKETYDTKGKRSEVGQWLRVPVFALSLLLNVALIVLLQRSNDSSPILVTTGSKTPHKQSEPVSEFAGLARDIPTQWNPNAVQTETAWDELWNSTRMYPGIISLTDDYARAKGLPRAQRFPWDQDKGIYLVNGYHNLHCVLNIERSLSEYQKGLPQSGEWGHIKHCLLVLRDEIMCNADDTPRYTGFQPKNRSGFGQVRMCRDWSKLEEWASQPEREGCWRNAPGYLGEKPGSTNRELLDRYRFCREDSPYAEAAKTAWTDPSDWEGSGDVQERRAMAQGLD